MRPKSFKQYSEQQMLDAINAVNDDGMSQSQASKTFDVPRIITLHDQIKGKGYHCFSSHSTSFPGPLKLPEY